MEQSKTKSKSGNLAMSYLVILYFCYFLQTSIFWFIQNRFLFSGYFLNNIAKTLLDITNKLNKNFEDQKDIIQKELVLKSDISNKIAFH